MAPPPRPSSYRRSYAGPDTPSYLGDNSSGANAKEHGKEQMKKLNGSLSSYIEKVRDVETANRLLAAENEKLRRGAVAPAQAEDPDKYEEELKRLRAKIEQLHTDNVQLQVERDNALCDKNEADTKLRDEKKRKGNLQKEVASLRKDVDDAKREQNKKKKKLEDQQEKMDRANKVHEEEMKHLRGQAKNPAPAAQVEHNPSAEDDVDLNDAIANIRRQHEEFNAKSLGELDDFHKEKVEGLKKQLNADQDDVKKLRAERSDNSDEIQRLQQELEALRGTKNGLEKSIAFIEGRAKRDGRDKDEKMEDLQRELDNAKQDMGKYLKDYRDLHRMKISLDEEIAMYQKLIMNEEIRLSELNKNAQDDKTGPKTAEKPNKPAKPERVEPPNQGGNQPKISSSSQRQAPPPEPTPAKKRWQAPQKTEQAPASSSPALMKVVAALKL